MKLEKEKYKNDKIINLCLEMLDKINKIKQDEYNITDNEYQGLMNNIQSIIESRIEYLFFWED